MTDYELLMIPGPTNLPDEVLAALGRPQISHRVSRFRELVGRVTAGLQTLFATEQPVMTLTSSSTGAMEAAVVNLLSPGDPVVVVDTGKFGERFGEIAGIYGAQVYTLKVERGSAVTEAELGETCAKLKPQAVLMVQNETSTGVWQDVQALAEVARSYGALSIVDAVSSLGGAPLLMDAWGLDAVVSGSQKTLMLPPGLGFVALSQRAWAAVADSTMPRYYFDLVAARKTLEKGETPFTPNTSLFVALEAALDLILAEGLEPRWARHHRLALACQAAVRALGLELFAAPGHASDTITSVASPVDSQLLTKAIREKHQIIIAGGQSELKGKIFRIGHMGVCQLEQLLATLVATAEELNVLGHACDPAAATAAAVTAWEAAE
ncbi:MAG TPA: alanine--glyoxylate aminotransferase family protein [Armatimonadota bacterium]|jgi:aspartate aminotransferase-like enzyme